MRIVTQAIRVIDYENNKFQQEILCQSLGSILNS